MSESSQAEGNGKEGELGPRLKKIIETHAVAILGGLFAVGLVTGFTVKGVLLERDVAELARYRELGASPEQVKGRLAGIGEHSPGIEGNTEIDGRAKDSGGQTRLATDEEAYGAFSVLRAGLQPLRDSEIGLSIGEIPPGVFGYLDDMQLEFALKYGPAQFDAMVNAAPLFGSGNNGYRGEVHKFADGSLHVLGYASEADLRVIEGETGGAVTLFLVPWEEAKTPARVPLKKVTGVHSSHFRYSFRLQLSLGVSRVAKAP